MSDDGDASPKRNVTVFGCGSFGTALAYKVAQNGHNVTILARNAETCASAAVRF